MFSFFNPKKSPVIKNISEKKDSNNVNVNVTLSGTNDTFGKSTTIQGTNNFDRIRNNFGKHQAILQRLSQYNSNIQAVTTDTLSKMETMPKAQEFIQDYYSMLSNHETKSRKGRGGGFNNNTGYEQQLRLKQVAALDEVDEVLTKLTTELTMPTEGEKHFFQYDIDRVELEKAEVKKEYIEKIEKIATDFLPKIYRELGFKLNGANNAMHNYLIEGRKAYELIYDDPDKPKKFLHAIEIDAQSLTKFYHNGSVFWKYEFSLDSKYARTVAQYNNALLKNKQFQNGSRILYDWQVNHVDWYEDSVKGHISYVHSMMKSSNILRIMEETMIVWYVTNSSYRTVHKVPTQGLMGSYAATAVLQEKEEYTTDIEYTSATGEIMIEDSANIPFERTTFISDGEYGEPSIEVLNDRGAALDKTDVVDYFKGKLYRASKMPQSRFDEEGGDWAIDPTRAQREEVYFAGFCHRIRNTFAPLLLKPLFIQIGLEIPELEGDVTIFDNINIKWNSVNQFKQLLDLAVLTEKLGYIEKIRDSLVMTTIDGDDIPIIPWRLLLQQHLGYTAEDLEIIEKARYEETEKLLIERKNINELKKKYGIDDDEEGGGRGGRFR